ncbi:MAG: transporter substrate-binding domain-containing protein [Arcobacteraceae bacterium]|nr:transporter substrate-binding domain-containing protein [Arcobacteraceae bacterium]
MLKIFNLITIVSLLFINTLFAKDLDKVSIQLQWLDQFQFAGYYIAKHKGYYKDVGLDVEIKKFNNMIKSVDEVKENRATYGVGRSSLIIDKSKGADIKLLAAIFQSSPLIILARKDSNIKSLKDFAGKRIMITPDASTSVSVRGMMNHNNVSIKELIKQVPSFNINDLIDKKTDLMSSYISNEPFFLKQKGIAYTIFDPKDYGFNFYSDILFTSDAEINNHPQRTKNFTDASIKGWEYAFNNIDETVELILQKYNSQNKSKEALIYEANELKKLAYYETDKLGHIDINKIQRIYDIYNVMGFVKNKIDIDKFMMSRDIQYHLNLTSKEKNYISSNTFKIGMVNNFYPFSFKENGKLTGYSYDLLNLITKKSGLKINIETNYWSNILNKFKNKKLDLIDGISYKKQREYFVNFSKPYREIPNVIFARKGVLNNYTGIESLKGKKVGITKDMYYYDTIKELQLFELVKFNNSKNKMKALAHGKVDAIINNLVNGQKFIKQAGYTNIEILDEIDTKIVKKEDLRIGVKKEDKILFSIINKSMNAITMQEKMILDNKWFGVKMKPTTINRNIHFTHKEKQFLKNHPKITVHNETSWPPFNFNEKGKPKGFSIEYMNLVAKKLGIEIKYISGPNWNEFLDMIKNKDIDVMLNIVKTPKRSKYINFTDKYVQSHPTIFTKLSDIKSLKDLEGKTVAVPKGFYTHELLTKYYPKINLYLTKNILESIEAVAYDKADATISDLGVINFVMQKNVITGIQNRIKIKDKRFSNKMNMGIRKDYPVLRDILQKGIDAVSVEEAMALRQKWFGVTPEKTNKEKLNLTKEEKAYLKSNPIIKAHNETNWPPFNFNKNGVAKGYSIDYMNLMAKKLGVKVEYISGYSWSQFMDMLQTPKLDVIINISKNKQREKTISFTDVFLSAKNAIYTNIKAHEFHTLQDLENKTIAMPKGFFAQKFLEKNNPNIKQILVKDSLEALKLLSLGKVDATIGKKIVLDYIIENSMISNVVATQYIEDRRIISHIRLGSAKEDKVLINILKKVQKIVTQKEINKLKHKWFGAKMKSKTVSHDIQFTVQEKQYLKNKKELTVCIKKGWLPYESVEDGKFIGLSADFLNLYSSKLSIPLKITTAHTQFEILKLLKEKKCDIKPIMGKLKNTAGLPYKPTQVYMTDSIVLVTRIEQPFVDDLHTLTQTVVMAKGFNRFRNFIKKEYPRVKIKEVQNIDMALQLVANGKAYGYIGTSFAASYQIQKHYSTKLKIVNDFKKFEMGVGVVDDDPVLLSILNKVMSKTTIAQKRKIFNSWIAATVEKDKDYTLVWQIVFISLFIIFIILYWMIKFKTEIQKRKQAEAEVMELNHTLEDKIELALGDLHKAQKLAKIGSWKLDINNQKLTWSDETYRIFDMVKRKGRDLAVKDFLSSVYLYDGLLLLDTYNEHLSTKKNYSLIHRITTRKKNIKWIEERCETTFDENGKPLVSTGTIQDITDIKEKEQALNRQEKFLQQQSRLAQMGEMISMIAHQWRQPLNAISLTTNNLQFKLMMDDVDNELFKKEIGLIDEYSQHLSKTIDDFRGFFKDNKEKEITTLEKIVNSTLAIVKTSIENKNIKIITDFNCDVELKTYPSEIKQVVLNLIKNAEDALLDNEIDNPTITIQTLCTIDCKNKILIIKDNAGGIAENIMHKIFDPYYSTKKEKDGTGLGLYMSKTIIEEHCDGKLTVSNDKEGAVFKIVFKSEELDEFIEQADKIATCDT